MGNGGLCKSNAVHSQRMMSDINTQVSKSSKIPDGCCILYAGASSDGKQFTCPVLAIYTWHKTSTRKFEESGVLDQLGGRPGASLNRGASTLMKEFSETQQYKLGLDQKVQVLAIENILSINVTVEVKKEAQEKVKAVLKEKPPEELTCGEKVTSCCTKNICVCCHKEPEVEPDYQRQVTTNVRANRVVTVTIEHIQYGNIDTPSHLRVLSNEKQAEFYAKHLNTERITFHYVHDDSRDESQFKAKLDEAESLARIITQLKSMVGNYPNEVQLQNIVGQKMIRIFGSTVSEDDEMKSIKSSAATAVAQRSNQDI